MRHEELEKRQAFDIVDVAEIWPRADAAIQTPLAEIEAGLDRCGASSCPDVPAAIGRGIVGVYAGIVAVLALTMATGAEASFMIVVSAIYVAIFLAVPRIFLRVEADRAVRPTLSAFMKEGMDTYTGRTTGAAALVQIFVVPVLLAGGLLAMGVAALIFL